MSRKAIRRHIQKKGLTRPLRKRLGKVRGVKAARAEYMTGLRGGILKDLKEATKKHFGPNLARWHGDPKTINEVFARANDAIAEVQRKWTPEKIERLTKRAAQQIRMVSKRHVAKQMRRAVGFDGAIREPDHSALLLRWAREQRDILHSLPERYISDLQHRVVHGVIGGQKLKTLQREIMVDRPRIETAKVRNSARIHSHDLFSRITRKMHASLGLKRATWRAGTDACPICEDLDGEEFDLDVGLDGAFPGEDSSHSGCDCLAEPSTEDLFTEDDEDGEP